MTARAVTRLVARLPDVEFADGSVCRVFQVRDTGVWFMDGVLD